MHVGVMTAGDGVSLTNWIDDRDDEYIDLFRCAANELRSVHRGGKIDDSERGVFRQSIKKIVLRAALFHFGASGCLWRRITPP